MTAARFLYNGLFLPLAWAGVPVASRFRPGLRAGLEARRGSLARWRQAADQAVGRKPRIWVHASSAGESLQARPLVESIRRARPSAALFFSWWSPSAAAQVEGWESVDHADALPLDFSRRMRQIVEWLAPDAVLLVGAETWPNFVWAASGSGARVMQACCRLAPSSGRLRWPARVVTRDVYRYLTAVAAVTEGDAERVRALGVTADAVAVTGDTRVDATLERLEGARSSTWTRPSGSGPVLVAGSTHAADLDALVPTVAFLRGLHDRLTVLVAPHDPTPQAIAELEDRLRLAGLSHRRLSAPSEEPTAVVIVDATGVLYRLYAAADVAYVGGAFDGSVHNTMEPAAQGVPIVVGPRPGLFPEVAELERSGALRTAASGEELAAVIHGWLANEDARVAAGRAARGTLERHRGATERTLAFLASRGLPA